MGAEKLIYLADDEVNIRELFRRFLEKEGYMVEIFKTGDELFEKFQEKQCDLAILDVMMPGRDGFTIAVELRKISNVPIIMLTARDNDSDYETGINAGADDYLIKPFSAANMVMKVKAIFRRLDVFEESEDGSGDIVFEDIRIQRNKKMVIVNDKEVELAPNEFNLLKYLMVNQDRSISREELLDKVWGYAQPVGTRVTDDTMKRLRKKLQDSSAEIVTIWGFGFRLKKK